MKDKHRKPSGDSGATKVYSTGEVVRTPTVFPQSKAQIERHVIELFNAFLPSNQRRWLGLRSVEQASREDDLDCIAHVQGSDVPMDLMEFAPLSDFKVTYDTGPSIQVVGQHADLLLQRIYSKSARYAAIKHPWLLIYTTDWKFSISDEMRSVVGWELIKRHHVFERVFSLRPLFSSEATVHQIYPCDPHILRLDPERLRKASILRPNQNKGYAYSIPADMP